jgi:predicted RNase H-like HicB family nuclease
MRQVVLYKDEDGVWIADVPSLPGCVSDGTTREEALNNIRDAIATMVDFLRRHGQSVPVDAMSAEVVAVKEKVSEHAG